MSDSVFMVAPSSLPPTAHGNVDHLAALLAHLRHLRKLCLRKDNLYRHSPLDESAWGRGNGFPALGLALVLSFLPEDSPARPEILMPTSPTSKPYSATKTIRARFTKWWTAPKATATSPSPP